MSARTDAAKANKEATDNEDPVLESTGEEDSQEDERSVEQEDPVPAAMASSVPAPTAVQPSNLAELSAQLREAAAEIAEIAAQAGRLGIAIDAAKALREGTAPEALRKLVLQRAAAAADARDSAGGASCRAREISAAADRRSLPVTRLEYLDTCPGRTFARSSRNPSLLRTLRETFHVGSGI